MWVPLNKHFGLCSQDTCGSQTKIETYTCVSIIEGNMPLWTSQRQSLKDFLLSHLLQRKENRTPFEEGWMRNMCQNSCRYLGDTVTVPLLNELSLHVETKPNDKNKDLKSQVCWNMKGDIFQWCIFSHLFSLFLPQTIQWLKHLLKFGCIYKMEIGTLYFSRASDTQKGQLHFCSGVHSACAESCLSAGHYFIYF